MKPLTKSAASLTCFFFGMLGIHRLLMGYKNWWMMPLTLGGLIMWMLSDLMKISKGKMPMADGTPLR